MLAMAGHVRQGVAVLAVVAAIAAIPATGHAHGAGGEHAVATPSRGGALPPPRGLEALVGALHEHSAYSDGWPGTRPRDYYESGAGYGLDFMGGSDHSENLGLPIVLSEACIGQGRGGDDLLAAQCAVADPVNPGDSFRKWDATAEQGQAAATAHPGFTAFRGFEWSSDRFGHINVYFSSNWTSAYSDGGYADMRTFWNWFTRPPLAAGGSDGIATFNHPGAKKIDFTGDPSQTGFNWNDFEYVPAADERMVGIEVFNDTNDYGSKGGPYPEGSYAHALDKGWHLGAVGAEDLGHRKPPLDNWGGPEWPKTVVLAPANTPEAIRAAMLDRRFYALGPGQRDLRLSFTVDGEPMGSRLERDTRGSLRIAARATDRSVTLELVTSGGKVVGRDDGDLRLRRRAAAGERWYFVRARRGATVVAYTSPVWVEAERGAASGTWYAGDGHVHTCYSHDAYCPGHDPIDEEQAYYSSGGTVAQRFQEAALKGLDFVTVSDHNDIGAQSDPAYGSQGVVGLPAYEASLKGGHAHMLGATKLYERGDGSPAATRRMADELRRDGGRFQANHPSDGIGTAIDSCDDAEREDTPLHWKYGYSVRPDTIEVWNATSLIQPAEIYWECWLQRGLRVGATAGSDSHGATQPTIAMPTTWVFARSRRPRDLLAAIEAGRTTLSRMPPALGGVRLLIEGDRDRDGDFESRVGDEVPPGTPLRIRREGGPGPGLVRVRANGETVLEGKPLGPGQEVKLTAPARGGWVRAVLYLADGTQGVDPACAPRDPSSPVDVCSRDLAIAAMTSPLYVGDPRPAPPDTRGPDPATLPGEHADEPDDDPPLAPVEQSNGAAPLPSVRAPRTRGATMGRLRARALSRCGGRATAKVRLSWSTADRPVQVQRRAGRRWRTVTNGARKRSLVIRVRCRAVHRFRARTRPAGLAPGQWRRVALRVR